MNKHNNLVFLIGFMGSGKSTVGKHLSKKIGFDFIDMDDMITRQQGKSVAQIFADAGEQAFREMEHKCLLQIIETKKAFVVATGGGTPCFFNNMDLMNKHGITVYLKMSIGGLFNRLKNATTERPLLKHNTDDDLRSNIKETLAGRENFYCHARLIAEAENFNEKALLAKLLEAI